ncbi:anthranilate synthase component I family protein [Streptomyces armeniacus]|uniref:Anthranilate synthase component I family protein n=1 Tax=Streptomyces armeniacus TaxID=83291 RepID=A0A345XL30_9ACTN|nr:chorismate-binding protein [Streptomyces armeniacus]AXK32346.1 anthranilate synthase component I family protein [Streptomyces armeniacus]
MSDLAPLARFGGLVATDLRDVTNDPTALDSTGWWAVVVTFEGEVTCARFGDVRPAQGRPADVRTPARVRTPGGPPHPWRGPAPGGWISSLDRAAYTAGVRRVREHISAGDVYQVNLCRVLTAPLPDPRPAASDVDRLTALLARGNPAPYAGTVRLPAHGVEVATASPELFLRRDGATVSSGPIKGTGRTAADLSEKDRAENVMIVDLVRNDLGRVCATGTVTVPALCAVEPHPGLVHLVSTVRGEIAREHRPYAWARLLADTFPPGSVSGAPKHRALQVVRSLETVPRGPYCGAVGWVDADRRTGELAVGIRTFWIDRGVPGGPVLRFGTGAGITWGSDPEREWEETELKASRLLAVASGAYRNESRNERTTT